MNEQWSYLPDGLYYAVPGARIVEKRGDSWYLPDNAPCTEQFEHVIKSSRIGSPGMKPLP